MAVKRRGLGRGLDALLGTAGELGAAVDGSEFRALPIEMVVRGAHQPRASMRQEALQELADSIRVQGIVQPIVVRKLGDGHYEIIAGERRWRAAQLAGLSDVPAVVRDVSDQGAMAMALIENIQREDLNPLEQARAFKRLIDEFDMTHLRVSEAVGRSRVAVSNLLRLLELCDEVQHLVQERKLEMGHARALLSLSPALQKEAAQQVLMRGLSVRETEDLVRRLNRSPPTASSHRTLDPDVRVLQQDLSERIGCKVIVQHGASGKGRLVIHYNSLDELDGIVEQIGSK